MSLHTQRRHEAFKNNKRGPVVLDKAHPAIVEMRTLFPWALRNVRDVKRVLVSGDNSRKLGKRITKGRWKGMPIFMLTLEERYTCPTTCKEWRSCYGNRSHYAKRIAAGPELEDALEYELGVLQQKNPEGFVVRLHMLGDFYSVEYAEKWLSWLRMFPALRVFGYTAHAPDSHIGKVLARPPWSRWAMRFSGRRGDKGAVVFDDPVYKPVESIHCPAQTGKTECCASCSLCWATKRSIAFKRH